MKLFTIAASILLSYIHSGEAAAQRLRINTKEETSEEVVESDDVPASRKRVSTHVKEGQSFFILDGVPTLYEDPTKAPVIITFVYWLCQPTTAPGLNGDGMYDSIAAHVNGWRPPSLTDAAKSAGATGVGNSEGFTTHGYTASWVKEGGYYNEFLVDFGDTTVAQINGDMFVAYETSPPGTTGGLTSSAKGIWTSDPSSHPLLQQLVKLMGTDLTPEACAKRYAETWNGEHSVKK